MEQNDYDVKVLFDGAENPVGFASLLFALEFLKANNHLQTSLIKEGDGKWKSGQVLFDRMKLLF